MIRKTFTAAAFQLLLLLLNSHIFAQTIIREKVKINPVVKLSASATEDYSPIVFQFGGPRPFSFVIESPSGSVSGSNPGWAAPFSIVEVPAINGDYKVTVTNSCECNNNVDYNVTWLDPNGYTNRLAGYSMWISMGAFRVDSFKFNRIPLPPPQEELQIKINLTGQREIWPNLPAGQINSNGYNPITNAIIRVMKGTQPQANQSVKINVKRIEGTGGHDHTAIPQPPGESGTIKIGGSRGNPQTATTNSNGECITEEILSSEFGGKYILEAALESNPTIKDTVHITVKVSHLQLLPASNIYNKIGGTEKHYGPPSRPNDDHNHWGALDVNMKMGLIADRWKKGFPSENILQINDMSLPLGGLFDHKGNWDKPHSSHRIGRSIDIRTELPGYKSGVPVRISRNASDWHNTTLIGNKDFERICSNNKSTANIHSPNTKNEHYHIEFDKN